MVGNRSEAQWEILRAREATRGPIHASELQGRDDYEMERELADRIFRELDLVLRPHKAEPMLNARGTRVKRLAFEVGDFLT